MNKRDLILQTTLNLSYELGIQATSIQLIMKKSAIAAGTIYYHFESKDELIDTLYSDLKEEMGKAVIQNLENELSFKEKFILIWKNLFSYYIDNPKKFEFLDNYAHSPLVRREIKEISRRHYQLAIDFFESGIQVGVFRKMPINLLINIVFGNVSTFTRMILHEEIIFSEDLISNVIQASWDSVKIN
jgi:AcrR family transcriptional regulator